MSDPLKTVRPGDSLRAQFTARAWNDMADAARDARRARSTTGSPGALVMPDTRRGVVLVKNVSGEDIDRFGVLELTGAMIEPDTDKQSAFFYQLAFEADLISSELTPICVLLEPLKDQEIGWAVYSGPVQVQVKLNSSVGGDYEDEYASMASVGVSARLDQSSRGPARILYRKTGAANDVVWAYVDLCQGPQLDIRRKRNTDDSGDYANPPLSTTTEGGYVRSLWVWDDNNTSGAVDTGLRVAIAADGLAEIWLNAASASYAGAITTGTQSLAGFKTFNDGLAIAEDKWIEFSADTVRARSDSDGLTIRSYTGVGETGAGFRVLNTGGVAFVGYDSLGASVTPSVQVYKTGSGLTGGGSGTRNGLEFVAGFWVGGDGETGLTGTIP